MLNNVASKLARASVRVSKASTFKNTSISLVSVRANNSAAEAWTIPHNETGPLVFPPGAYNNPDAAHHEHVQVTFIDMHTNKKYVVKDAQIGETLMDAAQRNKVPIRADCGGNNKLKKDHGEGSSCSACHVFLASSYVDTPAVPDEIEQFQLDSVVNDKRGKMSRMACMVEITEAMNGIVVALPRAPIFHDFDLGRD